MIAMIWFCTGFIIVMYINKYINSTLGKACNQKRNLKLVGLHNKFNLYYYYYISLFTQNMA